ncbi:MAG: GYD domain-containing protein [Alphaproteobacteria bacterium]|nr:GYD domain-containing protein [Alphaproteobacteria bacterium]
MASGKPGAVHCWYASLSLVLSGTLPPPLAARTLWNRAIGDKTKLGMPLYLYQAAYAADSWAALIKNPQNRIQAVGQQACDAVGGKLVGAWLCLGNYDLVIIAEVPDNESMAAVVLATGSGGNQVRQNDRSVDWRAGRIGAEESKRRYQGIYACPIGPAHSRRGGYSTPTPSPGATSLSTASTAAPGPGKSICARGWRVSSSPARPYSRPTKSMPSTAAQTVAAVAASVASAAARPMHSASPSSSR